MKDEAIIHINTLALEVSKLCFLASYGGPRASSRWDAQLDEKAQQLAEATGFFRAKEYEAALNATKPKRTL